MQLDLSRITLSMFFSLRHAAAASPDGPAPTITGPSTHTVEQDDDDDDDDDGLLNKGSCACFPSISLMQ